MTGRHFLDLADFDSTQLRSILSTGASMKSNGVSEKPLAGKTLAMIFDKPSTRTRVSFDVGMRQLGGETIVLSGRDMQLGRGESISDTAKVLSRYVDAIMIRTKSHSDVEELAQAATIPVINALTDKSHPCQLMADIMTFEEHKGPINGRTVAWTGDSNNVLHSLIEAAGLFDFQLNIATPPERPVTDDMRAQINGARVSIGHDAEKAVSGADAVVTDTWYSMGDEALQHGHNIFVPYQVNKRLMEKAASDAIFMHCLPAHRGEEVTAEVIDGPQSVVFDEAENRLHAQKAILAWCLGAT